MMTEFIIHYPFKTRSHQEYQLEGTIMIAILASTPMHNNVLFIIST